MNADGEPGPVSIVRLWGADVHPVRGSSRRDLDEELVTRYLASVRETTPRLVSDSDESVLYFTGVVADRESGELSVAGLYALGEYPQRLLPHLALTAAVEGSGDVRAVNRRDFTGALPVILDDVLEWVGQNVESRQLVTRDGDGLTEYAVPLLAAREVCRSLREAGMAEPRFYDNGVSFTVRFPNSALIPDEAW
ncbi:MAG: hypothetical protein ACFN4K_08315 [Pauljensenia sp.]